MLVLKSLIKRVNLPSLYIALPTPAGRIDCPLSILIKDSGLSRRTFERVFYILQAAGLIISRQIAIRVSSTEYRARPSEKKLNPILFEYFGLREFLKHELRKREDGTLKQKNDKKGSSTTANRQTTIGLPASQLSFPVRPRRGTQTSLPYSALPRTATFDDPNPDRAKVEDIKSKMTASEKLRFEKAWALEYLRIDDNTDVWKKRLELALEHQ